MTLLVVPNIPAPGTAPAPGVDDAVAALAQAGVPAYEARQQILRGVPFALGLDVERARGVAIALRAASVEAWAVDEETWAASPQLLVARSFRLFPEGIEVTTRPPSPQTAAVRWEDVELVLPARSVQSSTTESTQTKQKIAINPMKMLRGAKKETEHSRDESEERFVLLLARRPELLVRFDLSGLDYMGLGAARETVGRANYDKLVSLLKTNATTARVDDRLEKLASRLAGAPTAVSTVSSSAMKGATVVKKTERTFGNDNEGAVIHAARLLALAARLRRASAG